MRGIHRLTVNSPHKWPAMRKMFPFGDVIMSGIGDCNSHNRRYRGANNVEAWRIHRHNFILGHVSWWRHQMETFSALLAICAGNSPVPGEFPTQRPVTRSFDVFFDLRPNKLLSKQWWGWWLETSSCSLWRHGNVAIRYWSDFVWDVITYPCLNFNDGLTKLPWN